MEYDNVKSKETCNYAVSIHIVCYHNLYIQVWWHTAAIPGRNWG